MPTMTIAANPRLRIAIIGGGIGGLTMAVALSASADIQVDLYETASEFTEIGAGLGVWPRTWKALAKLGMQDDLKKCTSDPLNNEPRLVYQFRKSDQDKGYDLTDLWADGGIATFHRAHLQEVILKQLPPSCRCHMSKRLISFEQAPAGEVTMRFADGSTARLPATMQDTYSASDEARTLSPHLVWSGNVAYRALARTELIRERYPGHSIVQAVDTMRLLQFCGKYQHLLLYPIAAGNLINIVGFASRPDLEGKVWEDAWVRDMTNEELQERYSGWEPEVHQILACAEDAKLYAIHTVKPLKTYIAGHVALIGDAAHAMAPHQGSGAGQAVEDAYILAAVLGDPACTRQTLPLALETYDKARRPRAHQVMEGSRRTGILLDMWDERLTGPNVQPLFKELLRERIDGGWKDVWTTTADSDRDRAIDDFRKRVSSYENKHANLEI